MTFSFYVSVEHDESHDVSAYEGFTFKYPDRERKETFYSGDPVKDYNDMCEVLLQKLHGEYEGCVVMFSSSVDHFVFDVPGFYFDENDRLQFDEERKIEDEKYIND